MSYAVTPMVQWSRRRWFGEVSYQVDNYKTLIKRGNFHLEILD